MLQLISQTCNLLLPERNKAVVFELTDSWEKIAGTVTGYSLVQLNESWKVEKLNEPKEFF